MLILLLLLLCVFVPSWQIILLLHNLFAANKLLDIPCWIFDIPLHLPTES